jgi:hypothetical protein
MRPPRAIPATPTEREVTDACHGIASAFDGRAGWAQSDRPAFRIKYVAEGAVYVEGGRAAGLAEDMKLTVYGPLPNGDRTAVVAELEVVSVAASSAVCEIKAAAGPLQAGDMAFLSSEDLQKAQMLKAAGTGNHYAQTISFTDGDPLDEARGNHRDLRQRVRAGVHAGSQRSSLPIREPLANARDHHRRNPGQRSIRWIERYAR